MSFTKDFLWGAASAAYQIEGAYLEDGKGMGIWDTFGQEKGYIAHDENGNIACDHYHRFKEDVALMKEIGLKSYRFSVSWPRVMPKGHGEVNRKGLQFYIDLVEELLSAGIIPIITLYHWDLPTALYEQGGWKNPKIVQWFKEYTDIISKTFAGKIQYWLTFNEPQVFAGFGYKAGFDAPFEKVTDEEFMLISKHIFLAHGKAVQTIRRNCPVDVKVGFSPTNACVIPKEHTEESIEEARQLSFAMDKGFYFFSIAWWSDPMIKGEFSKEAKELFGDKLITITNEEWETIAQPLDFYGFNIYMSKTVPSDNPPFNYKRDEYCGSPRTTMEWSVTPEVMYWCCKFLYERYGLPLIITENGMSNTDWVSLDGKVHDPARIDFVHRYLQYLKKAADEGIPVLGYLYWSVMDNFEWTRGYDKRFGLIYVDYRTLERTIKDSAYWYREVIQSNGEILKKLTD